MPPLPLTSLVQSALPGLSPDSRAVVRVLGCCNGQLTPTSVAQWLGLRTRYQVARLLRRDGLPPFEDLAAWTRVLYWLRQSESTGASLLQLVRRDGLDPSGAYRLVHRVTGLRWSELRRSEEHTSELQSQSNLVCRLLLEKKKIESLFKSQQSLLVV